MQIELFKHQDDFVFCPNRFVGAFSGKRGGKTESGAIKVTPSSRVETSLGERGALIPTWG